MLDNIEPFGVTLLVAAAVVSVALLSNRISTWVRVPAPAIFLLGAAAVSEVLPSPLSIQAVEQIVTVALILILFKGGLHIGWRWLRDSVAR